MQFLRYVPALCERLSRLTVEVPPALSDLARMFAGVETVVPWSEHAPVESPPWDVQIEINELPYLFRTTAADLPIATRYLELPKQLLRIAAPVSRHASNLRVGLVWASGPWNPARSVPLDLLAAILETPGCEFWNLQGGPSCAEWCWLPRRANLHDADLCGQSLPHLAALIAQLDLVITPDTLAAHLAGALGTPAWLLLEHAADWRWQNTRCDSPWYPSLHLFRQSADGDWSTVVSEVQQALHRQVFCRTHPRLAA